MWFGRSALVRPNPDSSLKFCAQVPGSEEAADAAPAAASTTTEVTLYTCPTGGWVMGNRKPMEEAIKKEIPGAVVKHKVGYPLTAVRSRSVLRVSSTVSLELHP